MRLRKFLSLSPSDRYLLAHALVVVMVVRLSLWIFPFRRLRNVVEQSLAGTPRPAVPATRSANQIVWSVAAVSRLVPRATCLTQALAAHVLLARQGYSSRVRVGVGRARQGELKAHAWLEHGGEVVIGGAGMTGLTPLPAMEGRRA